MASVPSSDDSFCRMVLTRGMAGLKYCSSLRIPLQSESHGGTNMSANMPPPINVTGDDMVCDKMVSDDLSASPLTMSGSFTKTQVAVRFKLSHNHAKTW
jgi:hypothetical protein